MMQIQKSKVVHGTKFSLNITKCQICVCNHACGLLSGVSLFLALFFICNSFADNSFRYRYFQSWWISKLSVIQMHINFNKVIKFSFDFRKAHNFMYAKKDRSLKVDMKVWVCLVPCRCGHLISIIS